jgi:hypothetical protein
MNSKRILSSHLALAVILTLASSVVSTVVKAQDQPYLKKSINGATPIIQPGLGVNEKIKVLAPGGGINPRASDFNDKGNPSLPKFGEAPDPKGSFVNFKKPDLGAERINPVINTRPSAVQKFNSFGR